MAHVSTLVFADKFKLDVDVQRQGNVALSSDWKENVTAEQANVWNLYR